MASSPVGSLAGRARLTDARGSVLDDPLVLELVRHTNIVGHLAGIAEPMRSGHGPLATMDVIPLQSLTASPTRSDQALIHDAAYATEARVGGRSLDQVNDTACFSFYATKNLPIGEGGIRTTRHAGIAHLARRLRSHGMTADAFERRDANSMLWQHLDMKIPRCNYKMTELAGLLGSSQLAYLDAWRIHRAGLAAARAGPTPPMPTICSSPGSTAATSSATSWCRAFARVASKSR